MHGEILMEEKIRFRMRTELADLYERARRARDDAQQLIDNYHRMLAWASRPFTQVMPDER
jgi:hypothetical protein